MLAAFFYTVDWQKTIEFLVEMSPWIVAVIVALKLRSKEQAVQIVDTIVKVVKAIVDFIDDQDELKAQSKVLVAKELDRPLSKTEEKLVEKVVDGQKG